jgi:glycosyltransferase involved in cell wall biosynthesis
MASPPRVTIVTAVYERDGELRRALDSLAGQSLTEFECLVVDDASTMSIAPIVAGYDKRFVYIRSAVNLGCTGVRYLAYERARGDYLAILDSDNELFPWALDRACGWLDARSDIDGVAGLYVVNDEVRMRVTTGGALVTPAQYADRSAPNVDCVGVVRRNVVAEWLAKRRDYYNLDFHLWLTFSLGHAQLFVDEPWGRYHEDAPQRITTSPDVRAYRDCAVFVEEHRHLIGQRPCVPLDEFLQSTWVRLLRARRPAEARLIWDWMRERHVSAWPGVARRLHRRLPGVGWGQPFEID